MIETLDLSADIGESYGVYPAPVQLWRAEMQRGEIIPSVVDLASPCRRSAKTSPTNSPKTKSHPRCQPLRESVNLSIMICSGKRAGYRDEKEEFRADPGPDLPRRLTRRPPSTTGYETKGSA
jgi:hypothetical protein